jgi:hypothetical protein
MAYITPSDISQLALAGNHAPELETLNFLKTNLSEAYTVYHSVHWSRSYQSGTSFGEIDFVVVNQAGQVLIIEQKNGRLDETDQGLVKNYTDGAKNVGDQVRRSLENIREKFKYQNGPKPALKLDYMIYCPDYSIKQINAATIDADRVVDAGRAKLLGQVIDDLLGPGTDADHGWAETVEGFFRQSFNLVPNIHAHKTAHEKTFTRLSGGLGQVFDNLEMEPFRLKVRGTAGSGKSLIAHRAYQAAIDAGKKPLLVCFSRPLRERFNSTVGPGGLVQTWNGFCDEFLKAQGYKFDYDRMHTDPNFWSELTDHIIGETVPEDWLFDVLIVDEGQDFESGWVDVLKLFMKPDAGLIWLEDENQNLYGKEPVELDDVVGYRCATNFRSPETIARFIQRTLPFEFENSNDLPGLGVGVSGYNDVEDQPKIVAKVVGGLLKQGFEHADIVVLTCHGVNNSVFSELTKVGPYKLRKFGGEYDMFGNQILTDGNLQFDSIYRFKGQQAPAVILVDIDPSDDKLERQERLLFCGMSRATVRLELVVNGANAYCERFRH